VAPIVLATRRSPLALAQTRAIAAALEARGHAVRLREVVTTGDRWSARDAAPLPDRGMFVKELEEALLAGDADLAVHSAKDLPTELPPGLAIVAVPPRADARDVLVGIPGGPAALPAGARVGTGSPRREAQLRALRPDLEVVGIRGNVDTRLAKLDRGDVDALVLAAAGLARLGVARPDVVPLPVDVSTPAPGQGLLAIEGRAGDDTAARAAAALTDGAAATCLRAERALLAALGGGCLSPVGVHCTLRDGRLVAVAFRADDAAGAGASRVRVEGEAGDPDGLAAEAARRLVRTLGETASRAGAPR